MRSISDIFILSCKMWNIINDVLSFIKYYACCTCLLFKIMWGPIIFENGFFVLSLESQSYGVLNPNVMVY